ncbi:MAG TPA: hypothetical protein VGB70_00645 [Allosphingosinicella sp.]|jgi:hypothetical protein
MTIQCLIRGHKADAAAEIYNCGYYFSRCACCGTDMIRSGRDWREVPRGHRVVWKTSAAWHSVEPDFSNHLPILHRDSGPPDVPQRRKPFGKSLVPSRAASDPQVDADEAPEEAGAPGSFLIALALAAGLNLLFALRPRRASAR